MGCGLSCCSASISNANALGMPSPDKEIEGISVTNDNNNNNEQQQQQHLSCEEHRICVNGATRVASLHTQQGKKGPNQDSMIVCERFGSQEDMTFVAVFDGHGPYGHVVGRKVRNTLPVLIMNQLHDLLSSDTCADEFRQEKEKSIPKAVVEFNFTESQQQQQQQDADDEELPTIIEAWKESHLRAFQVMDKELQLHPNLDCHCSGTTAVTALKQGRNLLISNVGDSRAILGTLSDDGRLLAIQLTMDMKPTLPEEAERIKQCKGRVFALQDEPHVYRVWLPKNNAPGLAMTRAFGDFCLKDFGVIAVPDINYKHLTENDQFVVLATDGVWEVLSNEEVVHIVASASTRHNAAKLVVEAAVRAWKQIFPTSKIDDCAVVCLFLEFDSLQSSHAQNTKDYVKKEESFDEDDDVDENGSSTETQEFSSTKRRLTRADTIVTARVLAPENDVHL